MDTTTTGANQINPLAQDLAWLTEDRPWLVRLCTYLAGTPDAAEDLAQETLLEAWRHASKLHDPAGRRPWLAAIARNVCLRWRRSHWRTFSCQAPLDPADLPADTPALTHHLEQRELLELLEQALALLPAATRRLLIARYVHDLPYRTLAAHLDVSEDAISMRLSRARRQLQQVLTTDLRQAALSHNLHLPAGEAWQATRLWCPVCGRQHLQARLPPTANTVAFYCPGCNSDPASPSAVFPLTNSHFAQLLGGLQRPKVILRRASAWAFDYFRAALVEQAASCTNCNRPVPFQLALSGQPAHFLYALCPACGTEVSTSFRGLIGSLPEVQQFWDTQRRIRLLPTSSLEFSGQPSLLTRYQSLTGPARLEIISPLNPVRLFDTYQVYHATDQ